MPTLETRTTGIPGLLVIRLRQFDDRRGWFKENWNANDLREIGLASFHPVQQNVSYNNRRGVARGFHAEPWDKLVSAAKGRLFGAWIDLRPGPGYGAMETCTLDESTSVFVPRGVANLCLSLEDDTVYSYLVNAHMDAETNRRTARINPLDPGLGIVWPVDPSEIILSDSDRRSPALSDASSVELARPLVVGNGILGKALAKVLPQARVIARAELDLANPQAVRDLDMRDVSVIINAAAYTDADAAETSDGRVQAWAVNVDGVRRLVSRARAHSVPIVGVSSDYVFDGRQSVHSEDEPVSPLNVYGQTKAAGDALVLGYERGFVVRTSWVVGEGPNFVATMARLCHQGLSPRVVNDQVGRLTFAADLAAAIVHLLESGAEPGLYNVTNDGPSQAWSDVARDVYELLGASRGAVQEVSSGEYFEGKVHAVRPAHSTLALDRIKATGFAPPMASERLQQYVAALRAGE